jgi:predicted ribonuclease toxin of YeeF-YezG toxin-antitoxin module
MAQKGAGGNAGSITHKGGDGAKGSTGTGRGGGNSSGGKTSDSTKKKTTEGQSAPKRPPSS